MASPRLNRNECFEDWVRRVVEYEKIRAQKQLRSGVSAETVIEQYITNVNAKIMHYVIMTVKQNIKTEYHSQVEREKYQQQYLQIGAKPADHVQD